MENTTSFKLLQMYIRLDRWNKIMTDHELKNDAEVLEMLLQHYENTVQGIQTVAYCGDCLVPLALSCPKCSDAHAPPPSSAKDEGHAAKLSNSSQPLSESQVPLPPDMNASLSHPSLKTLAPKPKRKSRGRIVVDSKAGVVKASGAVGPFTSFPIESLATRLRSSKSKLQNAKDKDVCASSNNRRVKPVKRDLELKKIMRKCISMTSEELQQEIKRLVELNEVDSKELLLYIREYMTNYSSECPICCKKVRNVKSHDLQRHLIIHMPNPKVRCKLCGEIFPSIYKRYRHLREEHWAGLSQAAAKRKRLELERNVRIAGRKIGSNLASTNLEGSAGSSGNGIMGEIMSNSAPSGSFEETKAEGVERVPQPVFLRRNAMDQTEKEIIKKCNSMTMEELQEELKRFVRTGECDCKEYSLYIKQYVSLYSTECPVCQKELGNKSYRLERHLVTHMASPKVKCKLCNRTFSSLYRRYHHMREVHWKIKSSAAVRASLTRHGRINSKKRFELVELKRRRRECLYVNTNVRTKWDNMTAEEMEQEFEPFIKNSDYESKELSLLLDKYLKVSNGNCPVCHKEVRKIRHNLRRHLLTHMTSPRLKCSICPLTFDHPKYRNKHELQEHFLDKGGDVDDGASGGASEQRGTDSVAEDLMLRWDNMDHEEMQAEILRLTRECEFESKHLSLFLSKYLNRAYTGFCPFCGQDVPSRKDTFHRHLFNHMPHASATCRYCSTTFASLNARYRHELKEHSKSLKKKEAGLDRGSGDTLTAGQNAEDGPADAEGGSMEMEAWVAGLGQDSNTQIILQLDYPMPGTIADEHGYTLKVEGPDGSRAQPEEGLEQAVSAGLAWFGDQQKLRWNTIWDDWTLEQLVEKLKEFVRSNDHESEELRQFMPVYRRASGGVCHLCPKDVPLKATSTAALTRHLVTHMPNPCLKCPQCPLTFTSVRLQRFHLAKVHEQKECVCEVCGEAFTNMQKFQVHSSGCKNAFACQFCHKQYKSKYYCAKHEKIEHGAEKYVEHTCPTCEKTFHSRADLRKHIDVHGEKKYHCSLCPKKYFTKMGLTLHMAHHTTQPPRFECEVCNKKFHWKKNLEAHSRSHSNNRPFVCEVCGRGFKFRPGLAKHRRLHTGERPCPCPEPGCGRAFLTNYLLRLHRQSKHNYQPLRPDENAPVAASSEVIYTYFSSYALGDIPTPVEVQELQDTKELCHVVIPVQELQDTKELCHAVLL